MGHETLWLALINKIHLLRPRRDHCMPSGRAQDSKEDKVVQVCLQGRGGKYGPWSATTRPPTFLDIIDFICIITNFFCCYQCPHPFLRCIFSLLRAFLDTTSPFAICAICAVTSASFFSLRSRILTSHVRPILNHISLNYIGNPT